MLWQGNRHNLQAIYSLSWLLTSALSNTAAAASSSLSLSSTSSSISQAPCASHPAHPIQIPIRNISLSDQTIRRGAALSLGSPSEPFAFSINGAFNNTFVQDVSTSSCGVNDTRLQCSNQFGGLFDTGSSTSWTATQYSSLGAAPECCADQADDIWGSDTLAINTTLSLQKFPLGIFRGAQDPMNTLGLGRNSTLLNTLVSSGAIASNTFGVFQGWTGGVSRYQTDGALTLGGYDGSKISGDNITFPLNQQDNCATGLIITVADVKLNLRNGSNPSIFGPSQGSAIRACLEPQGTIMTLSEDIWWAFTKVTGITAIGRSTSPFTFWGMTIPASDAYDGDLTISIPPNLDIRIPNHQLVKPDIKINSNGQGYIPNDTEVVVAINSLQGINRNDIPRFGMTFLSSAYLMVDNDHKQFTLWKSRQSTDENLIRIGPPACTTSSIPPTLQAVPSAYPSPSPDTSFHSSVSKGSIAGGVVGGLAAIAFFLSVILLRKRRRGGRLTEEQKRQADITSVGPMKDTMVKDSTMFWKPEMPSGRQPPQELPLERDTGYDTAPYEMQGGGMYEMPATPRSRR